jgi:hypothetical protein
MAFLLLSLQSMNEKIFDTLKHKKDLESVGVPSKQAEKHVEVMGKIITSHLATKDEMMNAFLHTRHDFHKEISGLRQEMSEEFAHVRQEMAALEKKVIEHLFKYIALSTGILSLLFSAFAILITILMYKKL